MKSALGLLTAAALVLPSCSAQPSAPNVSLPVPAAGQITFYVSLPSSLPGLTEAATDVATPGSSSYRRFLAEPDAAAKYGASADQIEVIDSSIRSLGLTFAADPSRLFGRVSGTLSQWNKALGTPLTTQPASSSSPFTTYTLPQTVPDALEPAGTSVLAPQALLYDATAEGNRPPVGNQPTPATKTAGATPPPRPWPLNTGTPLTANCSASPLTQREVYTGQQVRAAYGIDALESTTSAAPVITVLDLGGGWLPSDLQLAGECFGYTPPRVEQSQGDGVPVAIKNADGETSLDLQTAIASAPGAHVRLVQSNPAGMLDALSRAIGDPRGAPDVTTLSYGGCALDEQRALPEYTKIINGLLAMAAFNGISTFVAAGDSGSTTCGATLGRTTLSYPAVSPFVTAVGGTRLALGPGNARLSETVWNDSPYGASGAGGGGVSRRESRPWYQDEVSDQPTRVVPDVSALADIVPGWPVVLNGSLQPVGGTSGSTPLIAAATALVAANERSAGRPAVGLANGWFYQAASNSSGSASAAFYDVTTGTNDLADVGCCQAGRGYDAASGLGVPNWRVLPSVLPKPA